MNKIAIAVLAIVIGAAAFLMFGKSSPKEAVNDAPFRKAIGAYLAEKSMGMEIKQFDSLTANSNKAEAVCRMKDAAETYNMSVKWKFTFEQDADKNWRVSGLER